MKLIDIKKAANILKITEGQIIELLSQDLIEGAEIINEEIYLPLSSVQALFKHQELLKNLQGMYSINSLSEILKVTPDTIRNWIKLKNISPDGFFQKNAFFNRDTVLNIKSSLEDENSSKLRSRRNKQYKKTKEFFSSYLPEFSPNLEPVRDVMDFLKNHPKLSTPNIINLILAECALQLINQRLGIWLRGRTDILKSFIKGVISLHDHQSLFSDLIPNQNEALYTISNYPDLFNISFYYEPHEDLLGCLYLSLLNISERKEKGIYYTPSSVVGQLIATLSENDMLDDRCRYFDPCCGTGNFIINLPKVIHWKQIWASDIDKLAVSLCRLNLFIRNPEIPLEELEHHITLCDYLKGACYENNEEEGPLVILGNPPWGARYDLETRKVLSKLYTTATAKNCESFDLFIEKSLRLTKPGDFISFVLPESILQVIAHNSARNLVQRQSAIKACIQLGEKFSGVNCPSIILTLKKEPLTQEEDFLRCRRAKITLKDNETFEIENNRYYDGSLELLINNDEYRILNKLLTISGAKYLKDQADWAIGIVTGDNTNKLQEEKTLTNEPILKGTNINRFCINKEKISYIEFKPEKFQQVAKEEFYRSPEKLFYRFINQDLYFAYDNKGLLSLNSANIVIPKISDLSTKYILVILNSCVARFIYKKKFHSTKVLRNHIEAIPIKTISKEQQEYFEKIADSLIAGILSSQEEQNLINQLDNKIGKLYGLNTKEVESIKKSLDF